MGLMGDMGEGVSVSSGMIKDKSSGKACHSSTIRGHLHLLYALRRTLPWTKVHQGGVLWRQGRRKAMSIFQRAINLLSLLHSFYEKGCVQRVQAISVITFAVIV